MFPIEKHEFLASCRKGQAGSLHNRAGWRSAQQGVQVGCTLGRAIGLHVNMGPPFCAASWLVENSCFSIGNTAFWLAGPLFSVILRWIVMASSLTIWASMYGLESTHWIDCSLSLPAGHKLFAHSSSVCIPHYPGKSTVLLRSNGLNNNHANLHTVFSNHQ